MQAVSLAVVIGRERYHDGSTCLSNLLRNSSTSIPNATMQYKICKVWLLSPFTYHGSIKKNRNIKDNSCACISKLVQFCETERFAIFTADASLCDSNSQNEFDSAAATISEALLTYGEIQGRFWANRCHYSGTEGFRR